MRSPMFGIAASPAGTCGSLYAGVSERVSTLRLISCKWVINSTLSFAADVLSRRGLRERSPVEIARRKMEETTMLSPASPRRMETRSTISSSWAGREAMPDSMQPAGCEAIKVRRSQPCWIPMSLRGESTKRESCSKSMTASLQRARTSLKGMVILEPLLNTAFHSDSPWRMKMTFTRLQLGDFAFNGKSSGFRVFLSHDNQK
mmetsp:Transcript_137125/g.292899  ORF Transcript_137125/g.292899 Transcript_137125/m.292899 type:complete len:203 (+) Transcript_137125:414-1022(+)